MHPSCGTTFRTRVSHIPRGHPTVIGIEGVNDDRHPQVRARRIADEPVRGDARLVLHRAGCARGLRRARIVLHHLRRGAPPGRAARRPVQLEPRNPGAAGMHHTAYTFDTLDDLLDRYDSLKEKGIEPKVPIQHGVTTSLYYQDPDGNFVELQIDNFTTPDEATAYMNGPEYANNPVGVSFVPELMRQALVQGTPVSEITTHSWALQTSPDLPDPMAALTS
ncbi:hypothetical protein FXW78_28040 [Rhodococcus opacus]|nr:hypothetical protein [Rhodococcus opacus]